MGRVLRGLSDRTGSAREVAAVFLRLGLIAFGGPLAHIALMREELVRRRRWLSDEAFLDLVAAVNLLPGPNSTELALHLGLRRAGWRGLLAAAAGFVLPACLLVGFLAWLYVSYGSTPALQALLAGVKPAVMGIVVLALLDLARGMLSRPWLLAVAAVAAVAYLAGVNELLLLGLGALAGLLAAGLRGSRGSLGGAIGPLALALPVGASAVAVAAPATLAGIGLVFLKAGALMFGSGYVLFAFLRSDLVERLGWLTDQQLLDAISAGQVTPGPLVSSATFVGYVLAGVPGALVATLAIFAPAFVFAALLGPVVQRLRRHGARSAGLDGLVGASLGLMAGVAVVLGASAVRDPHGALDAGWVVVMVSAFLLALSGRVGPVVVVAGGAAVGLLRAALA